MNTQLSSLEDKLAELYKGLPQLPENGRKTLASWAPWLSLVFGVLSLLSAWWLYDWAGATNKLVDYANELSRAYGVTEAVSTSRFTVTVWLAIAVMAVEGVIYLLAFPKLKDRLKSGWDLLFLGALINVVYGVVVAFTNYGGVSSLFGTLIGTAIGLYFLFQIRSHFTPKAKKK